MLELSRQDLESQSEEFEVLLTTESSQVATMTLAPGAVSGEYGNEHPNSDQHLLVVDGEAIAVIEEGEHKLTTGSFIVIAAGEKHQIRNAGDRPLKTLNVYAPPAYPPRE